MKQAVDRFRLLRPVSSNGNTDLNGGGTVGEALYGGSDVGDLLQGIAIRQGIPRENVVVTSRGGCIVEYRESTGKGRVSAVLHVYTAQRRKELRRVGVITMYKAETSIASRGHGHDVIICGDYGHDDPIVLQFDTRDVLDRFQALVYRKGLFSMRPAPALIKAHEKA